MCLLPFRKKYRPVNNEYTHQQYKCRMYRAKKVSCFLDAKGVDMFPWQARGSDSDINECPWSFMKRRLKELHRYPTILEELVENVFNI